MIAGADACGVRQVGDRAAVAQDEHAIGALDDLLELRRDHQDAEALVGELADQRLDLGLGADVDAARRLVEDQELRIGAEPAGEQHLLLVAAAKLADLLLGPGRLDGEAFHEPVDDRRWRPSSTTPIATSRGRMRERQVLAHRHVGHDAVGLAVLAAEADAQRDRVGGLARRIALPISRITPASGGSAPKIARAVSVRPDPSRPASPTIWPARTSTRDVADPPPDPQALGRQDFVAHCPVRGGKAGACAAHRLRRRAPAWRR